jgi:hypothetical protein
MKHKAISMITRVYRFYADGFKSMTVGRYLWAMILIKLAIMFLVLKLCNVIDWSWWWVTAPLWIPFAFVIAIFVVVVLFAIVLNCITALADNHKNRRR